VNIRRGVIANTVKANSQYNSEERVFLRNLLKSVYSFFNFFGIKTDQVFRKVYKRLIIFCHAYTINSVIESFKYFTSFRMNKYLCDPVVPDEPVHFFDFHLGCLNYFNRRSATKKKRTLSFLVSLLYLKRDCPPLPQSFIIKSEEKHRDTLSCYPIIREDVKDYLLFSDKVREIIKNIPNFKTKCVSSLSRRSCFENSLSKGGSQGIVSLNLQSTRHVDLRKFAIINNSFSSIKPHSCLDDFDTIHSSVKVHSILEPLKIRTITAEPANFFPMKEVQLWLWRSLQRFNCFPLTHGKDVLITLNSFKNEQGLPLLISGDYTAATDNLNRDVIKEFTTLLLPKLPPVYHSSFLRNSGLHNLHYKDGEVRKQENGQLMGSLTSFPILCYLNYIAYCRAKDICPSGLSDDVTINGDDIFFFANEEGYKVWDGVVREFGFTPSYGKNYVSRNYCTINSQWFSYKNKSFERVPFVNWELLKNGDIRSEHQKVSNYTPEILPGLISKFLEQGENGSNKKKLLALFKYRHFQLIKKSGRDFEVPIHFGGLYPYIDRPKAVINRSINTTRGRACYYANKSGVFSINRELQFSQIIGKRLDEYDSSPDDPQTRFIIPGKLSFIERYKILKPCFRGFREILKFLRKNVDINIHSRIRVL